MSEQVKRYDAVHIRYEDNNIHYGEGCEVEVVTAADYEREVRIAIAAGQRMQDKCDALQAEAEALRVVLHEIASVNPAERGIEWAKSYASDGLKGAGSELYARWLETFKEAEALRAENERLSQQLAQSDSALRESRANDMANVRTLEDMWERHDALRLELEAARGLLQHLASVMAGHDQAPEEYNALAAARDFTATPAPEVPDHTERNLEMAEQGERQEANQDMRALAASLYQACGAYDMPTRVLDVLSAAANGEPFAHMIDGLLPCVPPSGEDVRALVEALENCAAALAWNCFGECRAVHAGPIIPAAKALDTARAALATHRQAQSEESEQ